MSSFCALGHEIIEAGITTKSFEKDVLRVGHYVHPLAGWELEADAALLQALTENFDKAKVNGVKVPLVKGHEVSADTTLGYVTGLRVEADELVAQVEARGEDSIALLYRVGQVSACIEKDWKDGKGESYATMLTHLGVTPQPIVPAQKDFIEVEALSRMLSLESATKDVIVARIAELVRPPVEPLKPDLENAELRVKLAVAEGKLLPANAKVLMSIISDFPIALSRDGTNAVLFDRLLGAFGTQSVISLGERTGRQSTEMPSIVKAAETFGRRK